MPNDVTSVSFPEESRKWNSASIIEEGNREGRVGFQVGVGKNVVRLQRVDLNFPLKPPLNFRFDVFHNTVLGKSCRRQIGVGRQIVFSKLRQIQAGYDRLGTLNLGRLMQNVRPKVVPSKLKRSAPDDILALRHWRIERGYYYGLLEVFGIALKGNRGQLVGSPLRKNCVHSHRADLCQHSTAKHERTLPQTPGRIPNTLGQNQIDQCEDHPRVGNDFQ